MMTQPHVQLSVVTRRETTSWDFGRAVLDLLCQADVRLTPEIISNGEPHRHPFVDVEAARELWAPVAVIRGELGRVEAHLDFLWKRNKVVKCRGSVTHTSTNRLGELNPGQILLRAQPDRRVDWLALLRRFCELARPKHGVLHLLTAIELGDAKLTSPAGLFKRGPPGWAVESSVPNLGWANFFGAELAAAVDVERLQAHSFVIERIGDGVLVIVTDKLFEVQDDFAKFSSRRAELRAQFADDFVQIREEPAAIAAD